MIPYTRKKTEQRKRGRERVAPGRGKGGVKTKRGVWKDEGTKGCSGHPQKSDMEIFPTDQT